MFFRYTQYQSYSAKINMFAEKFVNRENPFEEKHYLGCKKTIKDLIDNINNDNYLEAVEKHDLCIDAFTLQVNFIKFEKESLEKQQRYGGELYAMVEQDYELAKKTLAENKPRFCNIL